MATKRLSRTLVEGGRTEASKYSRYQRRRGSRHLTRLTMNQIVRGKINWNDFEEDLDNPVRTDPAFNDRLAPLDRWLCSHHGQSWDKVFSKICGMADTRNLQQWHLVSHVKSRVNFKVENGILDMSQKKSSRIKLDYNAEQAAKAVAHNVFGVNKIRQVGKMLFLCEGVPGRQAHIWCNDEACVLEHFWQTRHRFIGDDLYWDEKPSRYHCQATAWKQTRRLTEEEAAIWNELNENDKQKFVHVTAREEREQRRKDAA